VTTDPSQALPPNGTLAPLGGQEAGHKGYGLALMVHILCGVLGGSYPGAGGNFLGVLEIEAFGDRASYDLSMKTLVADIKAVPRKASVDEIYLPGEHSARYVDHHRREGLTFPASQWAELTELARTLGVSERLIPTTS
jgi:LDH2 family malate/lactate/ureidoglycolate dehydrogenase